MNFKRKYFFTRISLLSSPTLPKRYVRPSQRRSSKASPDKKDECPWQRAMTRCSHGEKMFTKSSWPPVLPGEVVRRGRSPLSLMETHDNKPAVWRPCYTGQRPEISGIAVYKPDDLTFNPSYMSTQKNAYCSANASITRRQPSSEMAATYLTSGENTKSVEKSNSPSTWPLITIRTDDAPLRHLPMAHGVLCSFIPVASSAPRLGSSRIDGMPWGNSNKDTVQWVPLPSW
jgi:hypothetical protein